MPYWTPPNFRNTYVKTTDEKMEDKNEGKAQAHAD
jgi:hypothetical protein